MDWERGQVIPGPECVSWVSHSSVSMPYQHGILEWNKDSFINNKDWAPLSNHMHTVSETGCPPISGGRESWCPSLSPLFLGGGKTQTLGESQCPPPPPPPLFWGAGKSQCPPSFCMITWQDHLIFYYALLYEAQRPDVYPRFTQPNQLSSENLL